MRAEPAVVQTSETPGRTAPHYTLRGDVTNAMSPAHATPMIEERQLRVEPERPVRAWRLFRVRADSGGRGVILVSPMFHDPDPIPFERTASAICFDQDHPAPAPDCRCGIYGIIAGQLDSLSGYMLDTAHDDHPCVYAEVALSGRVFVDYRGLRAERCELLRIVLVDTLQLGGLDQDTAMRLLTARYRVPVGLTPELPDWVSGNQQPQGKPPPGSTLDLDTLNFGTDAGQTD